MTAETLRSLSTELATILKSQGVLSQDNVLAFARTHRRSALYGHFDKKGLWDDKKAAEVARLLEAGLIIRQWRMVQVLDRPRDVRMVISLPSDRASGHGFRAIADVLSDSTLRREYMISGCNDIKAEANRFRSVPEMEMLVGEIVGLCDQFIADLESPPRKKARG